jgi:lipoyl(octanoyl) transferase
MKLASLHLFEDTEARGAAENMALDEALFLQATFPVMRCYGWIRPSVSFGYFTPWRSVIERFADRDAVRRWTGGGIVEHGNDFTYSVIIPGRNSPTNAELYRFVHRALAELLREYGYPVEVSQFPDRRATNACFEKAVEFDLKVCDEKIAGAAVRRSRKGVLLQGSIQRIEVPGYFAPVFANALYGPAQEFIPSGSIMETTARIAKEKYGAAEWTRRF